MELHLLMEALNIPWILFLLFKMVKLINVIVMFLLKHNSVNTWKIF